MTVEQMYEQLIQNMKLYHPSNDFSMIFKAYELARNAHGEQLRKSGEPYVVHPLAVAIILSELELDKESITAGILHDVIEDTKYSYSDIRQMFGEDVADLVDGVTKLDKFEYSSEEEQQAENYRKMFLAMAKDIRVILIKIADRLHNMQTLKFMSPEKQIIKAQETLDIYAPLAHRLGISKVRCEMEDLSLRYLKPDAYYDLASKIELKQSERVEYVRKIVRTLNGKIEEAGLNGFVEGRPKHFFSIYKKMFNQNKTLDQIYDLFAVRIIVSSVRDCYEVLGILHELYTPMPGRFKDYIALPKANMYQSLHNTLMGPSGEPFEIQIRTHDMHRIAEYGIAAHWKYKAGNNKEDNAKNEEAKLSWLRQILEWQRDLSDNKEYLKALRTNLNVFKDHVYCFTPKGKVVSLMSGSTPIDFAYEIHTAIGNRMIGARVNGKIVTFEYVLNSGDRVEIMTSQNSKGPSRDWLKLVKTGQARNKINNWFRQQNKEENIVKGKELLEKEAIKKGHTLTNLLANNRVDVILNKYGLPDWNSLASNVGHGGIKEGQVINRLIQEIEKIKKKEIADTDIRDNVIKYDEIPARKNKHGRGVIVQGIGDVPVRFAKCCSPVPGDEIIAFITRGRGASVHRTDCINILNLDDLERCRILNSEWHTQVETSKDEYLVGILVICKNRNGILVEITQVFAEELIELSRVSGYTTKDDRAIFNIEMKISSKVQLEKITKLIFSRVGGVIDIQRLTT